MRARELLGVAALVGAPVAALGYAVTRAMKAPDNTPETFEHVESSTVVACLGASMLQGRMSFDVVGTLQARLGASYQLVNAGVNGDHAWNAWTRIESVIDCNPDYVIILIGSNDVMASANTTFEQRARRWKQLPVRPSLDGYRESLRAIVAELRQRTRAQIALSSLPPIGERLDSPMNRRLEGYNAVIREVAHDAGVEYLPINETLVAAISDEQRAPSEAGKSYDGAAWPMFVAVVEHYVLGRSLEVISRAHGYRLFTDGVHLNSRAGQLLVERFEAFVRARAVSEDTRAELL
ncbi:MAG: SGNH/GDSL hydrolase family protein [Polyangiales bacterium]